MTPTDEQIRLAIAEQAAEWFVAHRTGTLDERGSAAFAQWLKASPVHVEEYLRTAAISGELRRVSRDPRLPIEAWIAAATSQPPGVEPQRPDTPDPHSSANVVFLGQGPISPHGRRAPRWISGWRLAGVLSIPAIALAAFLMSFLLSGAPARAYETAHGAQRSWQLADGTMLRLNTDSAVEVRFSRAERVVALERGQAFFKVTHDAHRRFRVIAGQAEVVAVGTQFDVYRHGQTIQVTVLSGRVAVFSGDTLPASAGATLPAGAIYLPAGQRVRIVGGVIGKPAAVDLHETESWLRGQIAFEQLPLAQVAAEFNRYIPVPIEVDDPSLQSLKVSGVFDDHDSASFLAFVRTLKTGVVIERSASRIRVYRRQLRPAPPLP
jgi:transmembrane sensor